MGIENRASSDPENSTTETQVFARPSRRRVLSGGEGGQAVTSGKPTTQKLADYIDAHPGETHSLRQWGILLGGMTKQGAGQVIERLRGEGSYTAPLTPYEQTKDERGARSRQIAQEEAERARQEEKRLRERAEVKVLILAGNSGPKAAEMLGKEKWRVSKMRTSLMTEGEIPRVRKPKRSPQEIAQEDSRIKQLYDTGLSYALISEGTGLDNSQVKASLTRLGRAGQIIRRVS
jgi:hypothetical protein